MGDYLDGLPSVRAEELARVNGPGLAALRGYLESGAAVAFLGAGASAPLYPLWSGLIGELIDAAAGGWGGAEAETCRALAASNPESVVEIVRRGLSAACTAKSCGRCCACAPTRRPGARGRRCRSSCAGARSRRW